MIPVEAQIRRIQINILRTFIAEDTPDARRRFSVGCQVVSNGVQRNQDNALGSQIWWQIRGPVLAYLQNRITMDI